MNGATTSSLLVSRFNGSLVGDVFMIAGSKKLANTSWVLAFSSVSSHYWKA